MKKIAFYLLTITSFVLGSCTSSIYTKTEGNGRISPDYSGGHIIEFAETYQVEDFEFQAIPDEGWEFVEWIHYGQSQQFTDDSSTYYSMEVYPEEDHILKAVFRPLFANISTKVEGNGEISIEVMGARDYDAGTELMITAVAEEGWVFSRWEGVDLEDDTYPSFKITSDRDLEITAYFEQRKIDVSVAKNGEGDWAVFDTENVKILDAEDLNKTLRDVAVGTTLLFDADSNDHADFVNWEVEVTTAEGSQTMTYDQENLTYTIPMNAQELSLVAHFVSAQVVVPSGGIFDVNQFADFIDHFLPATKGGIEDFHTNHNWQGLALKSSNLEVYHHGEYGKNLYNINHHYAEEGYIDYSDFSGEKWSYGYNNLGQVSSISYEDYQLDVWYDGDQETYTSIEVKFLGELVYTLNPVQNGQGSFKFSVPGEDEIIEKSYTVNELGQVTAVTITGAPDNADFSLSRTHQYDQDGFRTETRYPENNVWATFSYYEMSENSVTINSVYSQEGVDGFIFEKSQKIEDGSYYNHVVSYLKLVEDHNIFELRSKQNKPESRQLWNASGQVGQVKFTEIDEIGRPEKGMFYQGETLQGSFEISDGKMIWKNANGSTLDGSEVSDWMRNLMQVFDDAAAYNQSFYSYDELYYP